MEQANIISFEAQCSISLSVLKVVVWGRAVRSSLVHVEEVSLCVYVPTTQLPV